MGRPGRCNLRGLDTITVGYVLDLLKAPFGSPRYEAKLGDFSVSVHICDTEGVFSVPPP